MPVDLNHIARTLTIFFNATYMLKDFEDYLFHSCFDGLFLIFLDVFVTKASYLFLNTCSSNLDLFLPS